MTHDLVGYRDKAFGLMLSSMCCSMLSLKWASLALLALILFVVSVAALYQSPALKHIFMRILVAITTFFLLCGLARFAADFALPGVVRSGQSAMVKNALSELRHIRTAQIIAIEQHIIDRNHNGIGAPLSFEELLSPQENGGSLLRPYGYLNERKERLTFSGYHFELWFKEQNRFIRSKSKKPKDEHQHEDMWFAYAWPEKNAKHPAYLIWPDGVIYTRHQTEVLHPFVGDHAPQSLSGFDISLTKNDNGRKPAAGWDVWSHKKKR